MTAQPGELLLTGATGFVGMVVLARHLERGKGRVIAAVRAADDATAAARVNAVLAGQLGARAAGYRDRVETLAVDLTQPDLGLSPARRDEVAGRVSQIIHAAASVSFDLPLEEARSINLEGTRRVLELAALAHERGGLERYVHVSTAYVAGTHCGRFHECEHDVGQRFRNPYERSKFEAESLVRQAELPATILRPSIVVGDRHSGWTAAFNVLYWPMRAFARGLYPVVPAIPSAPVDVVSIDYIADAIFELCRGDTGLGETYHLTASRDASTVGELVDLVSKYFRRPPPRVLAPDEFASYAGGMSGVQRAALTRSAQYFPYFALATEFDNAGALARLGPAGITASPLSSYLERLLDFATRSRWGKRPIARAEVLLA